MNRYDKFLADLDRVERLHEAFTRFHPVPLDTIEMQEISPGVYAPKKRTIRDVTGKIRDVINLLKPR